MAVSETFWRTLATVRAKYLAMRAAEEAEGRSGPTPVQFVRLRPEPALGDDDCAYADTVAVEACGG